MNVNSDTTGDAGQEGHYIVTFFTIGEETIFFGTRDPKEALRFAKMTVDERKQSSEDECSQTFQKVEIKWFPLDKDLRRFRMNVLYVVGTNSLGQWDEIGPDNFICEKFKRACADET